MELKLTNSRPNETDEEVFKSYLDASADIVESLMGNCNTIDDLINTINAGRVVPGVASMIAERVRVHKQRK